MCFCSLCASGWGCFVLYSYTKIRASLCASSFQHSFPLATLLIHESMYLFKIPIKANLDFISAVKNCVYEFSCSLRCVVSAGYSHGYRPCLFLQEMWLLLWCPASHPWCQVWWSPVPACVGGASGSARSWVLLLLLHWEPRFCSWREELLHPLGFVQVELGRFPTMSPVQRGSWQSSASCSLGFQCQTAILSSCSP